MKNLGLPHLRPRCYSETFEDEVAEDILEAVVPKKQDVALRNQIDSFSYQLSYIFEVLLSCGNMPWVDVHLLEMSKEELTGGSVVAVGAEDHVWKFEFRRYREEIT